jgi:hypothetical protein
MKTNKNNQMKTKQIDCCGNQRWYNKENQLHSFNDKPAIVFANGDQYWYQNGLRHRDNDKPAVVYANGIQYWYKNGKLIKSS